MNDTLATVARDASELERLREDFEYYDRDRDAVIE
jgi:hypothetical protein